MRPNLDVRDKFQGLLGELEAPRKLLPAEEHLQSVRSFGWATNKCYWCQRRLFMSQEQT